MTSPYISCASDGFGARKTAAAQPWAIYAAAAILILTGVFFAAPMPFIVDGGLYLDMARAMTQDGNLAIAGNGGVEGAPPLTKFLSYGVNGAVYPQYPSGYAFIAAPFYLLFGIRGLILINALSAALSVWLVWRIAARFYAPSAARNAALIFAFASLISSYAFVIWPHALALVFGLGAVYCAVLGASSTRLRLLWFACAGLLIGGAVNIRVDGLLYFPILFLWLRLFARPDDRTGPLMVSAGMAPGLLIAAYLNLLKFGDFTPLSYGPSEGADSIGRYLPLMMAGAIFLIGVWIINLPMLYNNILKRFGATRCALALALLGLTALPFAGDFIIKVLKGLYVLVINLQAHDAYIQDGVERNAYGQLMFWGYPKKALIQSLPYLPLILIPVTDFLRGGAVKSTSLCLLTIGAPIVFYAMNQWHGGGSYNMRYFIPALPFIAILSASAIEKLTDVGGALSRQTLLLLFLLAALASLGAQTIAQNDETFLAPASLYPQWLIALACLGGAALFTYRPANAKAASVTLLVGLFAIGYGAFLSWFDETGGEKARAQQLEMAQQIAAAVPGQALVLTQLPILLIHAEQGGASIMVATEKNIGDAIAAMTAFEKAGRCVYFQNSLIRDLLRPHLPPDTIAPQVSWAGREKYADDPRLAFYTLRTQTPRCAFNTAG